MKAFIVKLNNNNSQLQNYQLLMLYLNPQQPWFRLTSLMQYLLTPKQPQIELKDYNIES